MIKNKAQNSSLIVLMLLVCSFILNAGDGKSAPAFKIRDLKGKLISSEKIYGQGPSIVFFWHSCCGLNKDQLTTLKEVYGKFKGEGLEVVGIALDGISKTAKVKKAVKVYKMPWINVVDRNNDVKSKFTPTFVPALFVIAKGGTIQATFNGYESGDEKKQSALVHSFFSTESDG